MKQKRVWILFDRFVDFLAFLAGTLLLLVTLFVSYSVILRYLHFKPPIWILQCTEYALLWTTFLGAAWLLRKGGHIRIDTIVMRLDPKMRNILDIIVTILGLVVCFIILWFGTQKTFDLYERGIMDVKGVTLPKYPLFIVIPLGGLMLFLQFGRNLLEHLKALRQKERV